MLKKTNQIIDLARNPRCAAYHASADCCATCCNTTAHLSLPLASLIEAHCEAQRTRIARDVHDELGQVLIALRLDLGWLSLRFGALDPALVDKIAQMKTLLDRGLSGVRDVAGRLRSVAFDLGLPAALDGLCREFAQRHAMDCPFQQIGELPELAQASAVVIYRVAQESLTNISRHAQATQASVTLRCHANTLTLVVRDNGIGFDVQAASQAQSFGLLGMHERTAAIKGQLHVQSAPGQGCRIELVIPVHLDTPLISLDSCQIS